MPAKTNRFLTTAERLKVIKLRFCLGKSEAFRALVNRLQKIRSQFIVGFIYGQVELIETGNGIKSYIIECYLVWKLSTHHVCADGKRSVERSSRWIWNFCVPFIPSKAPKPCRGTFDVPVTNWRNLARSAWSKLRRARQNHWICGDIINQHRLVPK